MLLFMFYVEKTVNYDKSQTAKQSFLNYYSMIAEAQGSFKWQINYVILCQYKIQTK